ncbi:delta-aminolevulinic acid dehydratase, partial [Helicosporidium sp. ATCC 50920]
RRPAPKDKKSYQQDPGNVREALREAALDEMEGADALLVKPGLPYLDVLRAIREATALPLACYQVSGEYAMIAAAAERGWLDERETALEALLCMRRAGADQIMTYYAARAARWLADA